MKLLGYQRVHGEKDGKTWDFVNLFVEKESVADGPECGGSKLVTTYSKTRGTGFPSISSSAFGSLLRQGLHSGSDIRMYRDFDGTVVVELA